MHVYTTANGLLSNQFNFQSGYCDKKGRIYFGSINGFVIFDPDNFVENTFLPPVVITDFYLFNKRLSVDTPGSPLQQNITYADNIELDADQNSFAFQVAALSYQAPEMNRLMYKLEGFDQEWYMLGRNSMITYSNLPYGSYTLRIKGSNGDGKWNDVERVLNVRIHPPFICQCGHTLFMLSWFCVHWLPLFCISKDGRNKDIGWQWRNLNGKRNVNFTLRKSISLRM